MELTRNTTWTSRRLLNVEYAILACLLVASSLASYPLIAMATCLVCIVGWPLFSMKPVDWFSSWSCVFHVTILGILIRSIYITFDIPDSDTIQQIFLLREQKSFLIFPMGVMIVAMTIMTLGYRTGSSVPYRMDFKILRTDRWNETRCLLLCSVLMCLSLWGIYLLVSEFGLDIISANRGIDVNLSDYRGRGVIRYVAALSTVVSVLMIAMIASSRKLRIAALLLLLLSLGSTLFFAFYVSSRGGILSLAVKLIAIVYYMKGFRFPLIKWLPALGGALILAAIISNLRSGATSGLPEEGLDVMRVLSFPVLTTNFIDASKTGHIMAAVPNRMDYQWGRTLSVVFWAWIPRELWPEKPVGNIDNTLGQIITEHFYLGSGGLPPGLIAEMYLNFWYPGIIVSCFVLGRLLKRFDSTFRSHVSNRNAVVLYVTGFMWLGVDFSGSSFASVILGIVPFLVVQWTVLNLITRPEPARQDLRQPGRLPSLHATPLTAFRARLSGR
ncbi:MAG: oligosaccharide repeat unit polymerase [Acidobacteria bacterium]|nr:oligosaccharide repeat unit polymerase [Acidobacteriota bacterium]